MTRILAWAAIATLTTYLVFIGGGWGGIYFPELRLLSIVLAGAALGIWALLAWRRPSWQPRTQMWPAIAAALGSLAASTAFSRNIRVSAEYLGYAVVLVALYLLLVRLLADPFYRRRLVALMGILFVVLVAVYLGAVGAHWVEWWGLVGRLALPPLRPRFEGLTYLNPSAVLTMVALLAVPAAAVLPATRRGWMGVAAIAAAIGLIALLSGSRAGWFALALTLGVGVVVAVREAQGRTLVRRTVGRLRSSSKVRMAAIAAVLAFACMAVLVAPAVIRRLGDTGELTRVQYVVVAMRLFVASPVVGTGLGSWVIERTAQTASTEPDFYIPHAHDVFAQTLAEQGFVGVLAAMAVAAVVGRLLHQAIRGADTSRRRWAWFASAGLVYFLFHQLLDFYANMPAALFAAVFPIAYLDGTYSNDAHRATVRIYRRPRTPLQSWRPETFLALLTSLALLGVALAQVPALRESKAVALANAGAWQQADGFAAEAVERDPDNGAFQFTAGLTAARLGDHERAAALFEVVSRVDDLPEAWLNLASERGLLGNRAGAAAALVGALRLGSARPAVALAAGDLALHIDRPDLADDAFTAALTAAPLLAADPWWQADSVRSAALVHAFTRAIGASPPSTLWQLQLATGDFGSALSTVRGLDDAAFFGLVVQAWNSSRNDAATSTSAAYEECLAAPQDIERQLWCGRLASLRGDVAEGERFRTLAEFLSPGAGASAGILRVSDPDSMENPAGNVATFWGTFTYRSFTPQDMLVPSLVHLVSR